MTVTTVPPLSIVRSYSVRSYEDVPSSPSSQAQKPCFWPAEEEALSLTVASAFA